MCAHSPASTQCQIHCCYTYSLPSAGATQGELPEGQERVPWGIPVLRNSFPRYYGRHLRILSAEKYFTVGCGKANCGNAAREGSLGTTSAHRLHPVCTIYSVGTHIVRPRNALSNVFRANNVRPYGYAPANLFDAVRRGRRTLRCTVKSFGSIYRVERRKANCPKGRRSHTGVPRRATHLHIASPQGQFLIFYSQLLLRIRKKHRFRGAFRISLEELILNTECKDDEHDNRQV